MLLCSSRASSWGDWLVGVVFKEISLFGEFWKEVKQNVFLPPFGTLNVPTSDDLLLLEHLLVAWSNWFDNWEFYADLLCIISTILLTYFLIFVVYFNDLFTMGEFIDFKSLLLGWFIVGSKFLYNFDFWSWNDWYSGPVN